MKKVAIVIYLALIALGGAISATGQEVGFEVVKTHTGDVLGIITEDFDHDGYADILYSGLFDDTWIMYGKPNLEFEIPHLVNNHYQGVLKTGFINSDTLIDIILSYDNHAEILINRGYRNFDTIKVNLGNANLGGVGIGYFNDDAYPDMAIAPNHIFLGDGTGHFPVDLGFPVSFQSPYVTDLNNDGFDDIITPCELKMYLNNQDGTFTESYHLPLDMLVLQLSSNSPFADFNHDGNADFAFIIPHFPGYGSLLLTGFGNGLGGILHTDSISVPGTAYSLALSDVNRDNNLDLAISDASQEQLVVIMGDGIGNFEMGDLVSYQTDSIMHAMSTGDIDRDGNPDFIAGAFKYDSIAIVLNTMPDMPVLSSSMVTTSLSSVKLSVVNPADFIISPNYTTVAGGAYHRLDFDHDNIVDDRVVDKNLQYGKYEITISQKPRFSPNDLFSLTIDIADETYTLFKDYPVSIAEGLKFYFDYQPISPILPHTGQMVESSQPLFDWSRLASDMPASESYLFELADNPIFGSTIISTIVSGTEYESEINLNNDAVYYWRVSTNTGIDKTTSDPFAVYISAGPLDIGEDENNLLPDEFALYQNYPNPFNPETNIDFYLSTRSNVSLTIYNILGHEVKRLENWQLPAGKHTYQWDGTDTDGNNVASGTYFYRLKANDSEQTRKMIVLR